MSAVHAVARKHIHLFEIIKTKLKCHMGEFVRNLPQKKRNPQFSLK